MTILWVFISLLIGLLLYFIFQLFGLGLPMQLHVMVSMLIAGYLVYQYLAVHLG